MHSKLVFPKGIRGVQSQERQRSQPPYRMESTEGHVALATSGQ